MAKEIIILGMNISVSEEVQNLLAEQSCLQEAVRLLKARHPRLGEGYAEVWGTVKGYVSSILKSYIHEDAIVNGKKYDFDEKTN